MENFAIFSTNTVYRNTVEVILTNIGLKCLISESVSDKNQLNPNEEKIDWVIVDIFSRGASEKFLKELRNSFSNSRIIFITSNTNPLINYFALKYSAYEILFIEDTNEEFAENFRRIIKSKTSRSVTGSNGLTMRECEVLRLIALGKTSKEIAEELFISKNTVDTHRNKMLQKLNIGNSASLVTFACNAGLL